MSAGRHAVGSDMPAELLERLVSLAELAAGRQARAGRSASIGAAVGEVDDLVRHVVKLYSTRQAFRLDKLASAARLLEVHWPAVLGKFGASKKGAGGFYWRFSLPGVLSVHEKDTGLCLVRSVAGALTVIDDAAPDEGLGGWLAIHGAGWAVELADVGRV